MACPLRSLGHFQSSLKELLIHDLIVIRCASLSVYTFNIISSIDNETLSSFFSLKRSTKKNLLSNAEGWKKTVKVIVIMKVI